MIASRSLFARLSTGGAAIAVTIALALSGAPAVAVDGGGPPVDPAQPTQTPDTAPADAGTDPGDPGTEAPTGDPLLEGMTVPDEQAPLATDARLALPGAPVRTDAITSALVDPDSGRTYIGTRSASPARLYVAPSSTSAKTVVRDLPFGTGSWDLALSGTTLAIGTNAPTDQTSTRLLGYDTVSDQFSDSVTLPKSSIVMSVVEDTVLSTPGNGQYFWVGTYDAGGARLFRVDLTRGVATDYTPTNGAWKSFRYVRSLAVDPAGLTIGLGNPAAVWRFDRQSKQLSNWSEATTQLQGRSIAYAAAATAPTDGSAPTVVIGSEAGASVLVASPPNSGTAPTQTRVLQLPGSNTVEQITVDPAGRLAWFTVRPSATLYSLDLTDPNAQPQAHGVPEPGSETRTLAVIDGKVRGVTGTSEAWSLDPATDALAPRRDLIPVGQELRDTLPQGVVQFGDRLLVGGHWRYQVHGDPSVQRVRVPGEPKAQVVVGDKLYSAIYPSASVYELDSSLAVRKVASLENGQMRPAAIAYNASRDKLVVATGPAYGKYGGGLSLVSPAPDSAPEVYTKPVGQHQVSAIESLGSDLLLGTSTIGEAQPGLPGQVAKVVRWRADGDTQRGTGSAVWSFTVPVQAKRISGMALVDDEIGQQLVVAADPATTAPGWLFGLNPDTGALLWKQQLGGPVRWLHSERGYLVAQIGSSALRQVGVSRTGATLTAIRDYGTSVSPQFFSLADLPGSQQRVSYVSSGANGVVGVAEQQTPRVPSRLAGADRYATAVAVSQESFSSAGTVVLARGDDFADALSAGPLAAALDAPILLVQPGGRLSPGTVAEIRRLGATRALPIGGTGAIPDSVRTQLPAGVSLDPNRPQGANRYETSVAVAKQLEARLGGKKLEVFAATGLDFADAIAAVPAAIAKKRAIVLYDDAPAARSARSFLSSRSVDALGGPASKAVRAAGLAPKRTIIGADRFDTAKLIGASYFGKTPHAYVAPGFNFPDGLAAGVLAGRSGSPLLLSRPAALPAQTTSSLQSGRGSQRVTLVGGVGVLEPRLEQTIAGLR